MKALYTIKEQLTSCVITKTSSFYCISEATCPSNTVITTFKHKIINQVYCKDFRYFRIK